MRTSVLVFAAALSLTAGAASAQFPALQTTLRDPRADAGKPLAWCSTLAGARLCGEPLAEAWCRQHGFAKFVSWSSIGPTGPTCKDDDKACAVVATITCARVPIVSD